MQVITSNSATPLPSNLPTPLLTPLPSSDAIPINTRSSMFPVLHSVLQTNIVQRVWLMNQYSILTCQLLNLVCRSLLEQDDILTLMRQIAIGEFSGLSFSFYPLRGSTFILVTTKFPLHFFPFIVLQCSADGVVDVSAAHITATEKSLVCKKGGQLS